VIFNYKLILAVMAAKAAIHAFFDRESGRFFVKKLRKKLSVLGCGGWKRRSQEGVDGRFSGHDGVEAMAGNE
jgi:hypothetical protein